MVKVSFLVEKILNRALVGNWVDQWLIDIARGSEESEHGISYQGVARGWGRPPTILPYV